MYPPKISQTMAFVMGAILFLLGVAGFSENPLIGPTGIFLTDSTLNLVHIGLGVLVVALASRGEFNAAMAHYLMAGVFVILAGMTYVSLANQLYVSQIKVFDLYLVNRSDSWLHLLLAVVHGVSGMMNTASKQLIRD